MHSTENDSKSEKVKGKKFSTQVGEEFLDILKKSKPEIVKSIPVLVSAIGGFILGKRS